MKAKKCVTEYDIKGKRVVMRVDFNVPLDDAMRITDDTRIRAALPTIRHVLEQDCRLVLMSHLGRPKGKRVEKYSLKPVALRLGELLERRVGFADIDDELPGDDVVLLENLRFHPGERANDEAFARKLARYGEVYVSDAFGTVHRAHASTVGVARYLPALCGMLIEKEIRYLGKVSACPESPYVAVLGGAKVSDKVLVIEKLAEKADRILIGGAMAYCFIKASGGSIGASMCEDDAVGTARDLLGKLSNKIILPEDTVAVLELKAGAEKKVVDTNEIPEGWKGVDIGPGALARYSEVISRAKTVVWNGPMGVFEIDDFAAGTEGLAKAMAALGERATTVVGGGDSAAAVKKFGLSDKVTHVSTGGGASLEFLEGKTLPGIDCLMDAE